VFRTVKNLKQSKTVQESHPDGIHIQLIWLLLFNFSNIFITCSLTKHENLYQTSVSVGDRKSEFDKDQNDKNQS